MGYFQKQVEGCSQREIKGYMEEGSSTNQR